MSLPSLLSSARALAITALALTLSGCFDIEQSLRVRGDTFTYEAIVRIDARLVAMAEGKDKINCEKFKITQPPGALQVKIRSSEKNDGTNLVCQLAIEGPVSTAALADFPAKLELAPRSDDHPVFGKNGGMGFTIEKIARDRFRLTSNMTVSAGKAGATGGSPTDRLGEQFAMMLLAGRNLRWTVESEQITSSNGQTSASGTEVKWEVPLALAVKSPQTFTAEFRIPLPWYLRVWYGILDFFDRLLGR